MLRGSSGAWLCSLLAVCWTTGSALGSYLQDGSCNGPCLAASHARQLCEVVSTGSPCNVDLQLCCLKFREPHSLRTIDRASPSFRESASSSHAYLSRESSRSRQPRNIYVNIFTAVLSEAIRAAIASEYRDREEKMASRNSTEQYGLNSPEDNDTSTAVASQASTLHWHVSPQSSATRSTLNSDATEPETASTFGIDASPQSHSPYLAEVTKPTSLTATVSGPFPTNVSSSGEPAFAPTTDASRFSTSPATNDTTSPSDDPSVPCPGTCVPSFLSWFCEHVEPDYGCPGSGACCMAAPTTTTPAPVVQSCPSTCLHPRLTGLCRRPARLLLKTTTCGADSICCTDTPRIW